MKTSDSRNEPRPFGLTRRKFMLASGAAATTFAIVPRYVLGGQGFIPPSEKINLGAVLLRLGGRRLLFDAANMRITNAPEANKCLVREYRKGWELTGVGA